MGQQMVENVGEVVAHVPQAVQQRHVAQISEPRLNGEARGASKRQLPGTVKQGKMKQVRSGTNGTLADQCPVASRAGLEIDQG
jgi:hypothetical protein